MSVKVEKLEKNMAKLTVEVSLEDMEKAIEKVYKQARGRISVPGFRKGKAPRKMIERLYGAAVFLQDAANEVLPSEYRKAADESGLEIVSQPVVDVEQLEPGKPFVFTAEVAVKPDVTLGEYKGLEVPSFAYTVTDEDVMKELESERAKNSRTVSVEDEGAENGNIVTLDFEGFVDDVPFEGGKGEDYPLTLGSGSFIPGFEEQLVGAKAGEHVVVNVTFPEEYQAEELAGKEAVFQCDIKKVEKKELPELDDEFAQDVSEFDTLDEYKASIRENIEKRKADEALRRKEDAVVDKAVENAEMDIPDAMVDTQVSSMLNNFANRIQSQGINMDQYLQFTGMTREKLMEDTRPQALKNIQVRLVLEKIAEAEDIKPSEEEINEEIANMAKQFNLEADSFKDMMSEEELEQVSKDIAVQKAITLITESAVETEAPAEAENSEEQA
ncbi:MAG: trigger factor [Blautia sp.]|nr:trigger factor [Blautia sp.]